MLTLDIWHGDSRQRLRDILEGSIHAVICDPPYDLTQVSRNGSLRTPGSGPFGRIALATKPKGGFMGHAWDASGIAFDPTFWAEVLRILIPETGILKATSGTRTYHRMGKALRAAGFADVKLESWVYASGMPKSLDVSKAIDKHYGATREIIGYKRGVGGENLNDVVNGKTVRSTSEAKAKGLGAYGVGAKQVPIQVAVTKPATVDAELWSGYGTGEKPAWEPILTARRP